MLNEDYKEMLQCLVDEDVKFLLVGAYALAAHGYPRATMDIDLWPVFYTTSSTSACSMASWRACMIVISGESG